MHLINDEVMAEYQIKLLCDHAGEEQIAHNNKKNSLNHFLYELKRATSAENLS